MLQLTCQGSPYEIGFRHGSEAKELVKRGIAFYAGLFLKYSKQDWLQVQEVAKAFGVVIARKWPAYHEEMRGLSDGSEIDFLDIVALNIRTEIAFGRFSDGCTSLSWKTEQRSFLAQNWDWMEDQQDNLILMTITQPGFPSIKMVTEAGIIGKIGLNSEGVGVCLNAIRARGVDFSHIPVHLGLRRVLESRSAAEAAEALEKEGMASSAHVLVGDAQGSIGLEFTCSTFVRLAMDEHSRIYHTNHLLVEHQGAYSPPFFMSSKYRYKRIMHLASDLDVSVAVREPSWNAFSKLFEDHGEFPMGICRHTEGTSDVSTLFRIVMDLQSRCAAVSFGPPCRAGETIMLDFVGGSGQVL